MKNYIQEGNVIQLTAPAGGVVSGVAYQIGQLLVVATASAPAGQKFSGETVGVFSLPKAAGSAWAEGDLLYWHSASSDLSTVATGGLLAGCAIEAVGAAAVTGLCRLNGSASAQVA